MTTLSGRDASGLALLAQRKALSRAEQAQIMKKLSAPARAIAEILLKRNGMRTSKTARAAAARSFVDWAEGLDR